MNYGFVMLLKYQGFNYYSEPYFMLFFFEKLLGASYKMLF